MNNKIKPKYAFAAYHPERGFGINTFWIRQRAKAVRSAYNWKDCKARGWKIIKVKVSAAGVPR